MLIRVDSGFIHFSYYFILFHFFVVADNYSEEVDILRTTFRQRYNQLREITKRFLHQADKVVWKCDTVVNNGISFNFNSSNFIIINPKNGFQLAFSSYTEITNFLQGIVDNEANLNSASSCAGTCKDYRQTRHFHCQAGSLCDRSINDHDPQECRGIIRNCEEIDDNVNICETVCPIQTHELR